MHRLSLTIYYEDTDFSGYVYHANYLKYFSRAREEILGVERMQQLMEEGLHFVVHRIQLRFRQPAQFGDQLEIRSSCQASPSPRLPFIQRAYRGDELLVEAEVEVAFVGPNGKPTRLPPDLVKTINSSC